MKNRIATLGIASALGVVIGVAVPVEAGELAPPGGVVGPTMKDLDDVEPRRIIRNDLVGFQPIVIDQPGSYYLGEDVAGIPGQPGIHITVSNVSVDLNGFTLQGNLEVLSTDGVLIDNDLTNISVTNGVIRNFGGFGVNATFADGAHFRDLRISSNGFNGMSAGEAAIVTRCSFVANFNAGVTASDGSVIENCSVLDNVGKGISVIGTLVRGCNSMDNGLDNLEAFGSSLVVDTIAP